MTVNQNTSSLSSSSSSPNPLTAKPQLGAWTHYPSRLTLLLMVAVVIAVLIAILIRPSQGAMLVISILLGAAAGVGASWSWMRRVMNQPPDAVAHMRHVMQQEREDEARERDADLDSASNTN